MGTYAWNTLYSQARPVGVYTKIWLQALNTMVFISQKSGPIPDTSKNAGLKCKIPLLKLSCKFLKQCFMFQFIDLNFWSDQFVSLLKIRFTCSLIKLQNAERILKSKLFWHVHFGNGENLEQQQNVGSVWAFTRCNENGYKHFTSFCLDELIPTTPNTTNLLFCSKWPLDY